MADTRIRIIRIGRVSSIEYEKGTIKVTYPDLDDEVTDELPMLTFGKEYYMPEIGEDIAVAHLSNGTAAGMILGTYWNKAHKPPKGKPNLYRKDYSTSKKAYLEVESDEALHNFNEVYFSVASGKISVSEIIEMRRRIAVLEGAVSSLSGQVSGLSGTCASLQNKIRELEAKI